VAIDAARLRLGLYKQSRPQQAPSSGMSPVGSSGTVPTLGAKSRKNCASQSHIDPSTPEQHKARQAQVRLDPHQANALAAAYRAGNATKELATRFGIHRTTVTAVLQRLGVEQRQKGLSDEQVAEACRLYPEGWSLARLSERYDVTDMTVRRYLLLAGIVMRLAHERRRR
jgi:lambda repressor-like predicted transcriptional regulator